jgi:hypothetical protein
LAWVFNTFRSSIRTRPRPVRVTLPAALSARAF